MYFPRNRIPETSENSGKYAKDLRCHDSFITDISPALELLIYLAV